MSLTYLEQYDFLHSNPTPSTLGAAFIGRVTIALERTAIDVMAESPQTQNSQDRRAWAVKVIANLDAWGEIVARGVLANPTIALDPAAASDSDLQFAVNSLVDAYSARG